jgi:hypothetical protein
MVVMVLAALAAGKVWTQDQIYRSAAEEALIAAYRAKATSACQSANAAKTPAPKGQEPVTFATPASIELRIGNRDVDVQIWQIDHAAWPMRYKYPYLVLEAARASQRLRCSYDIKLDRATVVSL